MSGSTWNARDAGGGLLIRPDLFAQTLFSFVLFALRPSQLRQTPSIAVYCSAKFSKKLPAFPHSDGALPAIISVQPTRREPAH